MSAARDALALDARDNVATALRDLAPGETARVISPEGEGRARVVDRIPFGHKFALRAIEAGADVIKYGESIGAATAAIAAGAHVHVHNLASRRARGDLAAAEAVGQ